MNHIKAAGSKRQVQALLTYAKLLCISLTLADVLMPNNHHNISKHHDDKTVNLASHESYDTTHVQCNSHQTMFHILFVQLALWQAVGNQAINGMDILSNECSHWFYANCLQQTSHSLPVRASYEMYFVSSNICVDILFMSNDELYWIML